MAPAPSASKTRHNARAHHDQFYEKRMQDALEAFRAKKFKSLRQAAIAHKVNPRTLSDRNTGTHNSMKAGAERRHLVHPATEDVLVEWLGHKAEMGLPMDYREIRSHASSLAGRRVGKNWVKRFLRRHPQIVSAKPSKLDPKRAQNFNIATISDFFDQLESLFKTYGDIPPEHIWNMDEKGIQLGGGRKDGSNRRYIYLRTMHNHYRISSDNLELVTIVECINAAGDSLPPSFVLAEGPSPDLTACPDGSIGSVSTSPSGWTDDELTLEWMKNVFIPNTLEKRVDDSKPIVLLCDGHGSHETLELRRAVYDIPDTPIIILCFPSKCTHKLQPLDVVVFAQSQRQWREHCDERTHEGVVMNRYNVIQNYMEIREKHIFPTLVQKSFRKTGLYPVNRNVFTEEDFAPSKATSLTVYTPVTFPDDIPSSDPAVPSDADDDSDYKDSDDDMSDSTSTSNGQDLSEDLDADSLADDTESDLEFEFDTFSEVGVEDVPVVEKESPSPRYKTRFSTPSEFLSAPDLIAQCQRDMAAMQITRDVDKSGVDLLLEVYALRKLVNLSLDALQTQYALNLASDAHNTIIKRELETARVQLENSRRQRKNASVKVKARFLTLPQSKAAFLAEQAERAEKDRIAAEKEAEKVAEKAKRDKQVRQDARSKTFDRSLSSYVLKDELRAIARAMELPSDGSIKTLRESIRAHMDENSAELSANPRFAGLFSVRRRGRVVGEVEQPADNAPADLRQNFLPQTVHTHVQVEPFVQGNAQLTYSMPGSSVHHPPAAQSPEGIPMPPFPIHQHPIIYPNQHYSPYSYYSYGAPPGSQYGH